MYGILSDWLQAECGKDIVPPPVCQCLLPCSTLSSPLLSQTTVVWALWGPHRACSHDSRPSRACVAKEEVLGILAPGKVEGWRVEQGEGGLRTGDKALLSSMWGSGNHNSTSKHNQTVVPHVLWALLLYTRRVFCLEMPPGGRIMGSLRSQSLQ